MKDPGATQEQPGGGELNGDAGAQTSEAPQEQTTAAGNAEVGEGAGEGGGETPEA